MIKKATTRLYFLKQLKRAGLSTDQLFLYYKTVIRPVLKYCIPVWHYALTSAQTEQLEGLQKHAIHIILNSTRGMPYMSMLFVANLATLASHRDDISHKFFEGIIQPSSCLHHLLPPQKDHSVTPRLRTYEKFPIVFTRTK